MVKGAKPENSQTEIRCEMLTENRDMHKKAVGENCRAVYIHDESDSAGQVAVKERL